MKNHSLVDSSLVRPRAMLILTAVSLLGLIIALPPVAAAADLVWVGNDSLNTSNFTNSGNWQNNTLPSWGFANSLIFNQNQNSNVTGLNYNWGDWRPVNDIFWDTTFPVARTLSASGGGGIDFKIRIQNNSSFTQTVTMPLSGGKDGAGGIQLNPVDGSLILSGTIYNDNSVDYAVFGSQTATVTNLTLNTALGPNAPTQTNVDFVVAGGRNTAVQVNASQVWAGTTDVQSGSVTTANGVTLASSAIVVRGGTVATTSANTLADTATLTVNTGRLSIGGSDTVASLAGSGGTIDIASGATLTAGNANSTSYAGSITGSGGFTKVGSGTFTLSAASSYTGTTTVSAGRLSLAAANLLSDSSAVTGTAGAVFALGGNETIGSLAGSLDVALGSSTLTAGGNGQTTTYSGALSGSGLVTKLGSGTLTLSGNNTNSGGVAINAGALALGSATALGSTGTISFGGGTLQYSGSNTTDYSGRFSTAAGQQYRIDTDGHTVTLASNLTSVGGSFTKIGSGFLYLTGTNTYSGGTIVSGGQLIGTADSLQGAITNNAEVVFTGDGHYAGAISGTGSVRIENFGVMRFTGANTYTGTTVVNQGSFRLDGSIAGDLLIDNINTLSGTGTIGGDTLIRGTHSPGNSPGIQTFNGDLTYDSGGEETSATVNWELIANSTGSAGTNYDQIVMPTGDLSFSSATNLVLSFDGAGSVVDWSHAFWNVNRSWIVYDLSDGTTIGGLSNLSIDGSLLDAQGDALSSTDRGYFTTSLAGQDVLLNFVAVPEPSTWAMALAAIACGGVMVRRRRCSM